jgi:N-methylhydantoinase A
VERGIDPRNCVLIAFGGGGPLHACGLAEQLGVSRILIPPFAGVLSALGLAVAPPRRVAYASVMRSVDALDSATLSALLESLATRAFGRPPSGSAYGERAMTEYVLRMRYRGQGHELEIPVEPSDTANSISQRFAAAHQARYAFVLDVPVEVVSARCTRSGDAPQVHLTRRGRSTWAAAMRVDDGSSCDAVVYGRAVVALADATLLVADGWVARALPMGGWLLAHVA